MKRLITFILLIALFIPAGAFASSDYLLDVGPFTFDASGCSLYDYYHESSVGIQYPALEAYRGFGIGNHFVNVQYYTHEEMGSDYAWLVSTFSTRNNWEIAYYMLDWFYGKDSGSEVFLSCMPEPLNACFSPAGALFTCTIREADGGRMAGALFVTKEGVLFFDCFSFTGDEAITRAFRDNMLANLYFDGKPVLTDTPDPEAPVVIPEIVTGEPVNLSVGQGAGYSLEVEGYTEIESVDTDTAVIFYEDKYLQLVYYSIDEVLSPTQAQGLTDVEKAMALFEHQYGYRIGTGQDIAEMAPENESMPLKYCGITAPEYGGGYKIGAIVVNGDDMLVIDITAYDAEKYYDDLDFFRDDVLEALQYGGKPAIE